jgi:hypothetical protein
MRDALAVHLRQDRLRPLGYSDRAQFIRDAIAEKLGLPKEVALMKSRDGVGGSPSHKSKRIIRYPPDKPQNTEMNDGD